MKRTSLILLSLVLLSLLGTLVHAADSAQQVIGQQIGVDLKTIPTTPAEAKDALLKQQWSELIANNKYLGPVHRFFSTISPVFLVLFGENYSLSPTLLLVIVLWFYVAMELTILFNGIGMLNSWANRGIAVGCSIVLAQVGVFRGIGLFLSNLIYSPALWWARLLAAIGLVVGLFILHYIMKLVEKQLKTAKEAGKKETLKEELEKGRAFREGLEEGSKLGK